MGKATGGNSPRGPAPAAPGDAAAGAGERVAAGPASPEPETTTPTAPPPGCINTSEVCARPGDQVAARRDSCSAPVRSGAAAAPAAGPATRSGGKCPHVKLLKVTDVKKSLKKLKNTTCVGCPDPRESQAAAPSPWICLHCGKVHCSRLEHASGHVRDATGHLHAFDAASGQCWCFGCGAYISGEGSGQKQPQVVREWCALARNALADLDVDRGPGVPSEKAGPAFAAPPSVVERKTRPGAVASAKGSKVSVSEAARRKSPLIPGFANLGNTCFMNSTLQALCWTDSLADRLTADVVNMDSPLSVELAAIIKRVRKVHSEHASPRGLLSAVTKRWKRYGSMDQQDAHEFLRLLLDGIREDEVKMRETGSPQKARRSTEIDECFGGTLASLVVCDHCKALYCVREPFFDISVPIPSRAAFSAACRKMTAARQKVVEKKQNRAGVSEIANGGCAAEELSENCTAASTNVPDDGAIRIRPAPTADPARATLIESIMGSLDAAPRPFSSPPSLASCLRQFAGVDVLDGENAFFCERCSEKCLADEEPISRLGERMQSTHLEDGGEGGNAENPDATWDAKAGHGRRASDGAKDDGDEKGGDGGELSMQAASSALSTEASGEAERIGDCGDGPGDFDSGYARETLGPASHQTKKACSPRTATAGRKPAAALRRAYKRYLVVDAPENLVIHLKRFEVNPLGRPRKVSDFVAFDERLDLGDLGVLADPSVIREAALAGQADGTKTAGKNGTAARQGDEGKETAGAGGRRLRARASRYRLYAAVVHQGRISGGHYVAYVRARRSGGAPEEDRHAAENAEEGEAGKASWMYASDTHVRPSALEEVLQAEAYMLFYEREDRARRGTEERGDRRQSG